MGGRLYSHRTCVVSRVALCWVAALSCPRRGVRVRCVATQSHARASERVCVCVCVCVSSASRSIRSLSLYM